MSVVIQNIVVGMLVATCALFSAWRLATVRVRLRILESLDRLPALGRVPWLARLRERTLARSSAACGGCSQARTPARRDSSAGGEAAIPGAASPNRTPGALRR
jgi:hypothetical protein